MQTLRRALPSLSGHYLMVRNLTPVNWETQRAGIETAWVEPSGPTFLQLLQVAQSQGLGKEWCRERLAEGDACILVKLGNNPVGMGLVTCNDFWVEEISQRFGPGKTGCYLYGTYVVPEARGNRLQRLLDGQRLTWGAARGRHHAYALVERDNHPSIRGHQSSGFQIAARIDLARWKAVALVSTRRTSPSRPCGLFSTPGGFAISTLAVRFSPAST